MSVFFACVGNPDQVTHCPLPPGEECGRCPRCKMQLWAKPIPAECPLAQNEGRDLL